LVRKETTEKEGREEGFSEIREDLRRKELRLGRKLSEKQTEIVSSEKHTSKIVRRNSMRGEGDLNVHTTNHGKDKGRELLFGQKKKTCSITEERVGKGRRKERGNKIGHS